MPISPEQHALKPTSPESNSIKPTYQILNSLINIIQKDSLPPLVKSKDELINELKIREYSNEVIKYLTQLSRFI
ncbi:MAG TPA: hypothetical protein VN704_08435 [Verrucomicrobiae bacterium]|nr:hypothetical protein [Verrucomicrobiae bacterium]